MHNWKDKVKLEKDELDDKLGRLSYFIDTDTFEILPTKAKELILEQEKIMNQYSDILGKRLAL